MERGKLGASKKLFAKSKGVAKVRRRLNFEKQQPQKAEVTDCIEDNQVTERKIASEIGSYNTPQVSFQIAIGKR